MPREIMLNGQPVSLGQIPHYLLEVHEFPKVTGVAWKGCEASQHCPNHPLQVVNGMHVCYVHRIGILNSPDNWRKV